MISMSKTKITALFTALVLSVVPFTACASTHADTVQNSSGQTLEAQQTALTPFSIGYLPSTGHLLYFVAQEEGFFADEGLDVTLRLYESNDNMLSTMLSGKLDAGALGSNESLTYLEQGYDVSIIGGIMKEGHALVVKPDIVEGIDPEDYSLELLRGKRIAVNPKTETEIIYTKGFEDIGFEIGKDVEFVYVKGATYQALQSADVDATLVYTPFRAQAVKDGYVILSYSGQVPGFEDHPCCRNVVPNAGLAADPDAYKSYLKALIRAYKFYQENQDKTVEDILVYLDVDPDLIRQETYGKYISSHPDPDLKAISKWKDLMVKYQFINDFDVESHVNSELYKNALDEVIAEHPEDAAFYQNLEEHYKEFDT